MPPANITDESMDDSMDGDGTYTRVAPPNSSTHQGPPMQSSVQQGQPASSIFQQISHHDFAPHAVTSNHLQHRNHYQLPPFPPNSFAASSVLSGSGNIQSSTTTTTHQGQGQAQGNGNAQPQDSHGQMSMGMILHPLHSESARQEARAQQDALAKEMNNMTLDPRAKGPN